VAELLWLPGLRFLKALVGGGGFGYALKSKNYAICGCNLAIFGGKIFLLF